MDHQPGPGADALAYLERGHQAFLDDPNPRNDSVQRRKLALGQHPRAVILGCSDARVAPEIIYNCGLGELFVVRNAGHVLDDIVLGSLEFAVDHLGVRLIVVLGHDQCGAVTAAVQGGEAHGHLPSIIARIRPAVAKTRALKGDPVLNAVDANVVQVVNELKNERHFKELIRADRLQVVGQRYNLGDGTLVTL
jgi:carbonic anhydrase